MILTWLCAGALAFPLAIYRNYKVITKTFLRHFVLLRIFTCLALRHTFIYFRSSSMEIIFISFRLLLRSFTSFHFYRLPKTLVNCILFNSYLSVFSPLFCIGFIWLKGASMEEFLGIFLCRKYNNFTDLLARHISGFGRRADDGNDNLLFCNILEGKQQHE